MTKVGKATIAIASVYLVGIALLHLFGEGIAAAYLTLPGGLPVFYLIDRVSPNSPLEAALMSWTGNLVALVGSAALNVTGVYIVMRLMSKA